MNFVMRTFSRAIKPLFNIGLGQIPGVTPVYKYVWQHFGPKGIRLIDMNGFKLYVVCRDWAITPTMMFTHTWEPTETAILRNHIKEGMTVIDAGAYIGYYSVLASKLVGNKGKVYSFEPSPESLGVLRKNIELNDCRNVQVIGKVVSDKSGYATFYPNPRNLSGSTTFDGYSSVRDSKDPKIEIPAVTLDDVIGSEKVDFVKMDIEGGETKALRGMLGIIMNNPNLEMIIEVSPVGLMRVGSSLEGFVNFLQRYFRLHIIGRNGLTDTVSLQDIQTSFRRTTIINLFCDTARKIN